MYLQGLTDSLLVYQAKRYDIKGKQYLASLEKYYVVDLGLREMLLGRRRGQDAGHLLENVVYLELLRRGYQVYVGHLTGGEVDFVAVSPAEILYYQVTVTALDEAVLARELAPLQSINDNYPKYLLTLDDVFATADYDGIKKVNVLDWLLEKR